MTYEEQLQIVRTWRELSEMQSLADMEESYDEINQILRAAMDNESHPLAKFAAHWLGENLASQGAYEEAVTIQQWVLDNYRDTYIGDRSWGSAALERMAEYAHDANDPDLAIERYQQLISEFLDDPERLSLLMRLGELQEYQGYREDAIQTFETALEISPEDDSLIRLRLATLRSGAPWAHELLEDLVSELRDVIQGQDCNRLSQLMTKEVFYVAPGGGCMAGLDSQMIASFLGEDLAKSNQIEIDSEVQQHLNHRKAYLKTRGWNGRNFRGEQLMQLRKGPEGWVFGGIVGEIMPGEELHGLLFQVDPPEDAESSHSDPDTSSETGTSSHALTAKRLKIKAPWEKNLNFRAGGVNGSAALLASTIFVPWPFNLIPKGIALAKSFSPCGYGLMGFYYGQWGHKGSEYFAVDFIRFKRGVPFHSNTKGCKVLAVAEGLVSRVTSKFPDGSSGNYDANLVYIKHWDLKEGEGTVVLLAALISELCGNKGAIQTARDMVRYKSTYLHMQGGSSNPKRPKVKLGQYVPQGKLLGYMDDTGISALDHLHFSFYDLNTGKSIMLDDLDGQTLLPHEDGKCLYSTNRLKN
ncbi:hypothetical protein K8T06_05285 [bacterium]|nr:hypothetical protein [bacterium]